MESLTGWPEVLSCREADTGTWIVHSGVEVPLTVADSAAWWDLEAAGKGERWLISCARDTVPTICTDARFSPWLLLI